jgi:Tol biopolymer transport system component
MLVIVGLFLSGCGFIFNQPLVGPDGTTALFVSDDGTYSMLPEGDCHLALLRDGRAVHLPNVASTGDSGVLDWSVDGDEILFVEMEQDEFGQPIAWDVIVSGVQSDSVPVGLFHTEEVILSPLFTEEGDITYLLLQDDDDLPKLALYDREDGTTRILRDDIISYKRVTWDGDLAVISETAEGALKSAHIASYNIETGEVGEVASFFLSQDMEDTLFILPATFLWDVEPKDRYVALAVYDQAIIAPQVDNSDDQPTLYLIDPDEESARKVSDVGIMPAFSPNGYLLSYIGATGEDSDVPVIYLYDPDTQESRRLENTIGVSSLFWIDDDTLGFTIEDKEDTYKMMKVSPDTGEVTPLLPEI